MGYVTDDLRWDIESEIDSVLAAEPLVKPPAGLYAGIMRQVRSTAAVPDFHLRWMDFFVSLAGSLSVAVFLASFVFMPAALRSRAEFLLQWADYLGRISMLWVLPVLSLIFLLAAAGFTVTRSARLFR
jgi:hypothetical protein